MTQLPDIYSHEYKHIDQILADEGFAINVQSIAVFDFITISETDILEGPFIGVRFKISEKWAGLIIPVKDRAIKDPNYPLVNIIVSAMRDQIKSQLLIET